MLDYKPTIQTTLSAILPTSYELDSNQDDALPCATYIENNSYTLADGNITRYSIISYLIKIYTNSVADMMTYAKRVDEAMWLLGFERTSSSEQKFGSQLAKYTIYKATAIEQ